MGRTASIGDVKVTTRVGESRAHPPTKSHRRVPPTNTASVKALRSPPGGSRTTPTNRNLRVSPIRSPTQSHAVVNVNERRQVDRSPNGNQHLVTKTSPNGNSRVPAFGVLDNSQRRYSVRTVSPLSERPPKPPRESSLREVWTPWTSSANNNNSNNNNNENTRPARPPADKNCSTVAPHLLYPQFSHLLPSKSKPPSLHQRAVKGARQHLSAPQGHSARGRNAHGASSRLAARVTSHRVSAPQGKRDRLQFSERLEQVVGEEGETTTHSNVCHDPHEATVTLNVSDTIRRRIPRDSLYLEEDKDTLDKVRVLEVTGEALSTLEAKRRRFTLALVEGQLDGELLLSSHFLRINVPKISSQSGVTGGSWRPSIIQDGRVSCLASVSSAAEGVLAAMGNKPHKARARGVHSPPLTPPTPPSHPQEHPAPHRPAKKTRNNGTDRAADKRKETRLSCEEGKKKDPRDAFSKKHHVSFSCEGDAGTRTAPSTSSGETTTTKQAFPSEDDVYFPLKPLTEDEVAAVGDPPYQGAGVSGGTGAARVCQGRDNRSYESEAQRREPPAPSPQTPPPDGVEAACARLAPPEQRKNVRRGGGEGEEGGRVEESVDIVSRDESPRNHQEPECDEEASLSARLEKCVSRGRDWKPPNEFVEIEELVKRDETEEGNGGRAGEKRKSVEETIHELYKEEDSFCTSYLEEEFTHDIIKVSYQPSSILTLCPGGKHVARVLFPYT